MSKKVSAVMLGGNNLELTLYGYIGFWEIMAADIVREINRAKENGEIESISVRINSPGGDVSEGVAIYTLLKNYDAPVTVYVDGMAGSMASVIAMAGDTVRIGETAFFFIHDPLYQHTSGDAEELRELAEDLDKIASSMVSAYTRKTGQSEEKIKELMSGDTLLTAQEAVDLGFADEIQEESIQAVASIPDHWINNLSNNSRHSPQAFKLIARKGGNEQTNTGQIMKLAQLKAALIAMGAIDTEASDEAVIAAAAKAVSDLGDAQTTLREIENEQKQALQGRAESAVDKAIAEKRLKAERREVMIAAFIGDEKGISAILEDLTAPTAQAGSIAPPATGGSSEPEDLPLKEKNSDGSANITNKALNAQFKSGSITKEQAIARGTKIA